MEANAIELYSGVGGMHMAIQDAGLALRVVGAVDINTSANAVYRHNFPATRHMQRNIQSLTAAELDRMQLDLITMSPPCQPFSRLGKQADLEDPRTSSLLHLLQQLPRMRRPPRLLLVENVRGFERSAARAALLDTLRQLQLRWRELLISPHQLGVPNSRTRYYLMARRAEFPFPAPEKENEVPTEVPFCVCGGTASDEATCPPCGKPVLKQLSEYLSKKRAALTDKSGEPVPSLSAFLAGCEPSDDAALRLSDRTLSRYAELLDVVSPSSRRSCCFTSGYGHLVEGAGSVLVPAASAASVDAAYSAARQLAAEEESGRADCLRPLQLRYFSPAEVARLMCFTEQFQLPDQLSLRQRYKLLGNSVNVRTVATMLLMLVHAPVPEEGDGDPQPAGQ